MKQQSIKNLINQIRKVSNSVDQSLQEYLQLIRSLFDMRIKKDLTNLLASGIAGVTMECLFKLDFDEPQKLEALCFFRDLLQYEWNLQIRTEPETMKLLNILPQPIIDLLTDDNDESIILANISRDWETPYLIWNQEIMKEALMIYVEYNNRIIKAQSDYLTSHPIGSLVYPTLKNEVIINNVILRQYNSQPCWNLDCGLQSFIYSCAEMINDLLPAYINFKDQTTLELQVSYDRLSCKLLTLLTSLQLALEQHFFNHQHYDDDQIIQDYSQDQIELILVQQRETISPQFIKEIYHWVLHLTKPCKIHLFLKSSLLQSFYIITYSELAIILISESDDEFLDTILTLVLNVQCTNHSKPDKMLSLSLLIQLFKYKFLVHKLEDRHFEQIYQIYLKCGDIPEFRNVVAAIHAFDSQNFQQFIQKYDLVEEIFNNRINATIHVWRKQFEVLKSPFQEDIENEEKYEYPIIAQLSLDQLPHMPAKLKQRQQLIDDLYKNYVTKLKEGQVLEFTLDDIDIQSVRVTTAVRETPTVIEVDDDEIFA